MASDSAFKLNEADSGASQVTVVNEGRSAKVNSEGKLETTAEFTGSIAVGEVKIEGAEGHLAKVNSEGKLETTSSGGGGGEVEGKAANGAAVKGNPVLIAGSDGTDARNVAVDSSGRKVTVGASASGSAVSGSPVLIAGKDIEGKARSIAVNTEGLLEVRNEGEGVVLSGETATGVRPVLIGGSDGTDVRNLKVNAEGKLETSSVSTGEVEGKAANGAAVKGNPVLIAGSDGTDARSIAVNAEGILETISKSEGIHQTGETATGIRPVLIGGSDGTDVRNLKVTSEGKLETTGGGSGSEKATKVVTSPAEVRKFTFSKAKESLEILKENTSIKGLQIHNYGAGSCWLGLGQAAVEGDDIFLDAGAVWDGMIGSVLWQGSVFGYETTVVESEEAKLAIVVV